MDDAAVSHQTEAALIERAKKGDLGAFDQLVLLHQQTVFAVALRMLGAHDEAEEIAQEVFVRAYQAIGAFRQDAKLSTWLVSITMNLCRNRRRWWARRRRLIVASLDDPRETEEGTVEQEAPDPAPGPELIAQQLRGLGRFHGLQRAQHLSQRGQLPAAAGASLQMRLELRARLGIDEAVDIRRKPPLILCAGHSSLPFSSARSCSRARLSLDFTVPTRQCRIAAISSYEWPSRSRRITTVRSPSRSS